MNGPWEDYAQPSQSQPWNDYGSAVPIATDHPTVWNDLASGFQQSATGLLIRGKLPDINLDSYHAKWYDKALESVGSTVFDLPEMIAGGLAGSFAGTVGMYAGANAVPAEIRESLVKAYSSGAVDSSARFLNRVGIAIKGLGDADVMKATLKAAAVGALTAGAGKAAKPFGDLASTAAEVGTLAVAPAALEGRLPEPQDFINAAVVVGGLKAAGHIAGRIAGVYSETGIPPEQVAADARIDPEIAEQLKSDSIDVPDAYKPMAAAENAKRALPDVQDPEKAQQYVEQPFGEVPQAEGELKVDLYPNFKYINTPDDVSAVLARATELYGDKILSQTRGKVSWAETEQQAAAKLSEMVGANDLSLLTDRVPGSGAGTVEMRLRAQLMVSAVSDFTQKARNFDALNSTPQDRIEMQAAAERVAMLSANFQGAASETGRALNALKMINSGLRQADAINKLMEGSPDPEKISLIMKQADNPVAAAAAARAVLGPKALSTMQKVGQVYRAFLLSGFKTFEVKALGDMVATTSNIVERYVATTISKIPGIGSGEIDVGEANALVVGFQKGARDALKVAAGVWKSGEVPAGEKNAWGYGTTFGERANAGEPSQPPKPGSLADTSNRILAIPHRIMGMETEGFAVWNERGELSAQAYRQTAKEKFAPGTTEFAARMVDLIKSPTEAMSAAAKKAGLESTFTNELGKFGKALQTISQTSVGQFVLPFPKIPPNLVSWAVKRMPGVAFVLDTVRDDFAAGGAARDIAIARQAIGAVVATAAIGAVQKGTLTGGGLYLDPQQKQAKIDSGWQPYSLKIGGKYYSYSRFDPMARVAALAADASEALDHMADDDRANLPVMMGAMFGNAVVSQTYLSSINDFLQALDDPARNVPRVWYNFVGSWVPAIFSQIASEGDPYKRKIDSAFDAMQARIPYFRNELLPAINTLTGKPLENTQTLTPVNVSSISNDPVLSEASRLGVGVPKTPKNVSLPSDHIKDEGRIQLSPEQQNFFATTAGGLTHEILSHIVDSEAWKGMPDLVKQRVYQIAIADGRKVANAEVLTPQQRQTEALRIAADITRKLNK